jgi:GNAT superfamily N-acetyltransferase
MSLTFSKRFDDDDQRVEIWADDGTERLKDMGMLLLAPVVKAAYHDKQLERESVSEFMVLAYNKESLVVGGMLFRMYRDIWTNTEELATYQVGVLPEAQRKGVGTRMMDTLKAWTRERDSILIIRSGVKAGDEIGRAFMEMQEGFKLVYIEEDREYEWENERCQLPDFRQLGVTDSSLFDNGDVFECLFH